MVWPVAFPLEAFLTRAGITALGTAATSEGIKSLQNQGMVNPGVAKEAFMRTLMGPTTEILNRTTDTPSGKVFAPTGEVIESNQIPGMAPAEQPQGIPGLLPPQQEKQVEGMSQASPPTKDKGFTMPATEDMSTLYNVENDDPLNVENIQNKIKYKKSKEDKNITEAYLGDKKVGEIRKDMDSEKIGNQFNYTIHWTNEKGEIDYDDYNVETGFNSAKYTTALGLVNTIKSQEKEYLNKFIKAVENKDYDTLNKIREEEGGYDFENSEFRSKQFNDTINKYRPDLVKLSTKAYNEQQQAISELNIKEKPIEPKDIEKEITFKKSESADTYDVLYKGKLIKQLYKKGTKYEGQNEYVVIEPSDGSYDDTFIGLDNSKERVKQNIARQILEKNTSKSAGSLIDKPLSDE